MEESMEKTHYSWDELVEIIARLRGEGGCPWDREQTYESLIPCLRDEAEEVVQAIENHDRENLCEELGDVLLQVLMHAQIAKERGEFTIGDVIDGISAKMIRRHPHVFGDAEARTPEESLELWKQIKAQEKAEKALRR